MDKTKGFIGRNTEQGHHQQKQRKACFRPGHLLGEKEQVPQGFDRADDLADREIPDDWPKPPLLEEAETAIRLGEVLLGFK